MNATSTSSDNFKETLKQQADIVRIVGDYVKLKKAGRRIFPGFVRFMPRRRRRFPCTPRGSSITASAAASREMSCFMQKVENITFPEAVRLIAQKLGVPMPKVAFSSPAEARNAQLRMALLDVHVRATAFFQDCLRRSEGANAREYLKGRGLDEEIIARFRIGYAPDSGFLLRDALRGVRRGVLRESGLFSWKEEPRSLKPRRQRSGTADPLHKLRVRMTPTGTQ